MWNKIEKDWLWELLKGRQCRGRTNEYTEAKRDKQQQEESELAEGRIRVYLGNDNIFPVFE